MALEKALGVLKYKRSFYFGANRKDNFPINSYHAMRGWFGEFHKAVAYIAAR
jgi:hypothetical protein